MFPIENAFKRLLEPVPVPVAVKYTAMDVTPCITIMQADETFLGRKYVEIHHEQYIEKKYDNTLWVNIWANDERTRHELVREVHDRIFQAESNYYTTCPYYNCNTEECHQLAETCEVITRTNPRTKKGQCPNLKIYDSWFKKNHILKNTFKIESVTNEDELDIAEPVLRTIFKINLKYNQYWNIGGVLFENIDIEELI